MSSEKHEPITISKQALQRMPYYLECLRKLHNKDIQSVSAASMAGELNLNEVQVRKDLASVSTQGGKPKKGFEVEELIKNIEEFLGYNNVNESILVGAGHLGKALLLYKGFESCGMRIIAAFDKDEELIHTQIADKTVFPMERLSDLCKRLNVHIGIITVSAEAAQGIAETLIDAGIQAIWNFAPVHLKVPEHILVRNENMASSFALLSKQLREKVYAHKQI